MSIISFIAAFTSIFAIAMVFQEKLSNNAKKKIDFKEDDIALIDRSPDHSDLFSPLMIQKKRPTDDIDDDLALAGEHLDEDYM